MMERNRRQREWIHTAHRLRQVKRACMDFLDRWAVSQLTSDAPALDRFADDVHARTEAALADPANHDWSLLYRGSVLDD